MKKLLSFVLMCLMAATMSAQRCAVLEFKAGVGISQADVDGISAIFITYFRPAGYTMVERTQIDKAIDEQGFQRSKMTESQMVRIGQILNVSKIVVGDVNIVMGQYNVDARVINVESGTIAATEGATFASSSYRTTMQSIAQKLAGKIAITSGGTVQARPVQPKPAPAPKEKEPYVIYGYLKVFPEDLGSFESEPRTVISRLNQSQQYGYGTWRLPTNEELQLMRANKIVGEAQYMTKACRKGIVRLVTDREKGETMPAIPAGYVDLGLASGTLWKDKNEEGGFYTYEQAIAKFGSDLPTKEQLEELKSSCKWTWNGSGYRVEGPSGGSIVLPAAGWRRCSGSVGYVGSNGYYWSSTPYGSDYAWYLYFYSSEVGMYNNDRCNGRSVRLVR